LLSYLTLVNRVLRRLRETPVISVDQTPYSRLVGQIINDAKREVEDSWQWSMLLKTFSSTTVPNSTDLLAWPNTLGPRVRLAIDPNDQSSPGSCAGVASNLEVVEVSDTLACMSSGPVFGEPDKLSIVLNPASSAVEDSCPWAWQMWPYPDSDYELITYVIDPQRDLVENTDIMLVPSAPVEMRALLYLLYERGEELGEYLTLTSKKADSALADAISLDSLQSWPEIQFYV
jgi:hypothetical protein